MSWRRQDIGYYSQERRDAWSSLEEKRKKRKPEDHSVPDWEKQFYMRAGSDPLGKLVETKKYMPSLYKNIVQWNDSAGEEAFNHAKSRFWAEINGLPCNISLPDPDAYIDDVDWSSSNIDLEVILDLERSSEPKPHYYDHGQTLDPEAVVIIGLHHTISSQTVPCTGCGDAEEDLKTKENVHENPWEPTCGHQSKAAAMGGGWGSNTCNKWENNYSSDRWKNGSRKTNYYGRGDHGVPWGNFKSDVNGDSWRQNTIYKISRFRGGDSYQKAGGSWRKEEHNSRW